MLVFIDESEDPSIKLGCSPLFTVVIVIFEDLEEANRSDQRIDQQCFKLKLPKQFHFTKLCEDFLLAFLDAIVPYEFFYLSDRYQQENLYGTDFRYADSFYKYACGLIFGSAKLYFSGTIY